MFRSKTIMLLLVALLLVAPFGSSAPAAAQDDVVELEFVSWYAAEAPFIPALEALIVEFEAQNPNIRINSVALPFPEADQLLVRALGGDMPDISMTHTNWVGPLLEAGVLAPLEDGLLLNLEDYNPNVLGYYEGDLLTVAWAIAPTVLYYNVNLLNEAGYDAPPQTFDELTEMAYAIDALDEDYYGMAIDNLQLNNSGFYFYGNIIRYFGGQLFDEDGNVVINSPETVAAYEFVDQIFEDGLSPEGVGIREIRELFAQGIIGFHRDNVLSTGFPEAFTEGEFAFGEDYDLAPFPGANPGEPGPTFFVEHQLAIYEDSDHKEEAALFIDFLTGPEGTAIINSFDILHLPVRESTAALAIFTDVHPVVLASATFAEPLPGVGPDFPAIMQAIATGVQRVVILDESPENVVRDIQAEVEDAVRD
ncbi:MAG: sugar ABC transporter substrate-binding protein [Anaerolineae bacterium]|nr:sugar ABC transporter substrate-binding protein [Anaerolineae bacterium]